VVAIALLGSAIPTKATTTAPALANLHAVLFSPSTIPTPQSIYHGVRYSSNGAWNGFNNLAGAAPNVPVLVSAIASAGDNGDLHVLVASTQGSFGNLFHAMRHADGSWQGFNNVSGPATVPQSSSYPSVAAAIVNGDLHVLLVVIDEPPLQHLYHAVRHRSTGAWSGFNLVTSAPGNVISVAAAAVNGDLHVLIAQYAGGSVWHAIRYSYNGAWTSFNDVARVASVPSSSVWAVAAAAVGGDLHVLAKTSNDVLYHAIRVSSTGAWKGFNDMSGFARVPNGATFPSISVAGVNGDLQLLVAAGSGHLYHALRSSSTGAWNGLNDVSCCTSSPDGGASLVASAGV
jgi:hypothetical protein